MPIDLQHFCTKTGKPITVEGQPVAETIQHCVAEYLAPDAQFSVGTVYPGLTTPDDLTKHAEKSLEFTHKDRFFFSDTPLRDLVFDRASFGAAYGSLLFSSCQNFQEFSNLRVLVVDDETGECGGVLPPEKALQLVGDGDGRIDAQLHEALEIPSGTQFQVRGAIKAQPDSGVKATQLIKGTLAPLDLSQVGNGCDLVLSKSQLGKGRKNQANELGIIDPETKKPLKVGNEMAPGFYLLTVGLGNREHALYRDSSLGAQPLNCLPSGVKKDILPRQLERLKALEEMAGDPRQIALDYIQTIDRRTKNQFEKQSEQRLEDFADADLKDFGELIDKALADQDEKTIYKILKADLKGHCQLLETPKITAKLEEHFQAQLKDCALGRFAKFKSGMAMSCRRLQPGEVCDPTLPDGEEVIVYRPPVANTNVMAVLVNRHLEGEPLHPGSFKMHPDDQKRLKIDNDGDHPAYALAKDYPHLAAEITEKTLEGNRYAEIVTPEKASYSGSFEQIAIAAMADKTGIVADMTMKASAQENECLLVPDSKKEELLKGIVNNLAKNSERLFYPQGTEHLKEPIADLIALSERLHERADAKKPLTSGEIDGYLQKSRGIFRHVVELLSNELEIEVQSGKSANRSNPAILEFCQSVCEYPEVHWLEDRNKAGAYLQGNLIRSNMHGPIDLLVGQVNHHYQNYQLQPRPASQFHDLFKPVSFTEGQLERASQLKKEYDSLIHKAHEIRSEVEANNNQPYLKLTAVSAKGNSLEILINERSLNHPTALDSPKLQEVQLIRDSQNRWKVTAGVIDPETGQLARKENGQLVRRQIGYLSEPSALKNRELIEKVASQQNNSKFVRLGDLDAEVFPGYTKAHEKVAFNLAQQKASEIYQSIPDSEKKAMAAAMWHISTQKFSAKGKTHEENREIELRRRTGAAFAIFGKEIAEQLGELQFKDLTVVGTHQPHSEHCGRQWRGERVPVKVELGPDPADPTQNRRWMVAEGKKLAVFSDESPQLPAGTEAIAAITSGKTVGVLLTSSAGNQLRVTQTGRYDFAGADFTGSDWNGLQAEITIDIKGQNSLVARIGDKTLGMLDRDSAATLKEKLAAKNIPVQGFKFSATLSPAPASAAYLSVDPQTVRYPEAWTRDNQRVLSGEGQPLKNLQPAQSNTTQNQSWETVLVQTDAGSDVPYKLYVESNTAVKAMEWLSERGANSKAVDLGESQPYVQIEINAIPKEALAALVKKYPPISEAQFQQQQALFKDDLSASDSSNASRSAPALKQIEPPTPTPAAPPTARDATARDASPSKTSEVSPVRDEWEKKMLAEAMNSLKASNNQDEIQMASLGDGKYQAILDVPTQTLRVIDSSNLERGTVWKAQKGQPATICQFSSEEKEFFASRSLDRGSKESQANSPQAPNKQIELE